MPASTLEDSLKDIVAQYTGRKHDALLPVLWDIQTAFGHISPEAVRAISYALRVPEVDIYGVIGFYGGFIQAGSGLLMIFAFGRMGNLDIFQINSLKVFDTLIFITVSILVFAASGRVHWGYAAALSAGNLAGGWAGSHWQLTRSEAWINRFILATGLAMAAKLLWDSFST